MADGQVYDIPESQLKWFKEQIEKLGKRAKKLLIEDNIYSMVVGYKRHDAGTAHKKLVGQKIYQIFVAHPEVKLAGWKFIARIDHSQDIGNVIRCVPGEIVPDRYRDTPATVCEHCNIKRVRRDTFVLNHEQSGEYKQVGSSCLRDFLGHADAGKLAKLAEIIAIIGDYSRGIGWRGDHSEVYDRRYVNASYYAALVADSVKRVGWISLKVAKENDSISTSNYALLAMNRDDDASAEGIALADKALEWAAAFGNDGSELNEWQHAARVIAQSDALEHRHLGIAASIVGVYWAKFEKPQVQFKKSEYVGVIGKKITLPVVLQYTSPTSNSTRHAFKDAHGNVLIWFASNVNWDTQYKNKEIVIEATVKFHQEYHNNKQTIINRVKII